MDRFPRPLKPGTEFALYQPSQSLWPYIWAGEKGDEAVMVQDKPSLMLQPYKPCSVPIF